MPLSIKWTDVFLDQKRMVGDPLADDIITQLVTDKGDEAVNQFFHSLISNIEIPVPEIPEYVKPFLEKTRVLPKWADHQKLQRSEELFIDHGPKFLVFLYYKSLPQLYTIADGARVLTHTGRLAHDGPEDEIFSRRIAETGQFLLNVMSPGAFAPGGNGFESVQKVRLIHASIRHFLTKSGFDINLHGMPVNQEHMAATLMTFGSGILEGLQQFHITEEHERLEAYIHRWNVIGHLLGVDTDLLPENFNSGKDLLTRILGRTARSTEDGILLTQALIQYAKKIIPKERFDTAPELLIQYLIGDEHAKMLSVKPERGCLGIILPEMISKLFRLIEKLEDDSIILNNILSKLSMVLMEAMVASFNEFKGQKFSIPDALIRAWNIGA